MNHFQVFKYMYELGYMPKTEHYWEYKNYVNEMLRRNRVLSVIDESIIKCLIFFFITNNYEDIYKKSTWFLPNEDLHGNQIYIDKMVCASWTPSLRRFVQSSIEEKFPNVNEAYYHRAPLDRCVKIYKRGVYV